MNDKKMKCPICQRTWTLKDNDKINKFEARGKCPICHYRETTKKCKKENTNKL